MALKRQSRRKAVEVQYNSAQAATDYALAYRRPGSQSRFFQSRMQLVLDVLASCPGDSLLDAGCGPGTMVQELLKSRAKDFRITALDQSSAMVEYCMVSTRELGEVGAAVGRLEAMPFADGRFDVILVMGALEYADAAVAVREISRVALPGGLVVMTMLNPLSPYRLTEWFLYWPFLRALGAIEGGLGVPVEKQHGAAVSAIRALTVHKLRQMMRRVELQPFDLIFYDLTPLVPPLDRFPRVVRTADPLVHGPATAHGRGRWLGTAYLVAARKSQKAYPPSVVK